VGHLRVGAALRGPGRDGVRAPVIRTPGGLAKRLGRAVLWLLVLVLLLRGLAGVMEPRTPATVASASKPATVAWPDDQTRAFAADFARAYLTFDPKDPDASATTIRAFAGPELSGSIVPEYGEDAPRRAVGSVAVARVARVDDSHALVTVAAAATGGTQYVTVPVARDAGGGLVVSDLPSLTEPPARASAPSTATESLAASERGPIEDVVSRFLSSYLGGDAGALSFYVPAGVRIGALAHKHELVDVTSLALMAPAQGRVREVLATVRAKDAAGAIYGLRYRLRLVREDRWLVAAVNATKEK
jgi:conjugative transposon protein TcpC